MNFFTLFSQCILLFASYRTIIVNADENDKIIAARVAKIENEDIDFEVKYRFKLNKLQINEDSTLENVYFISIFHQQDLSYEFELLNIIDEKPNVIGDRLDGTQMKVSDKNPEANELKMAVSDNQYKMVFGNGDDFTTFLSVIDQ